MSERDEAVIRANAIREVIEALRTLGAGEWADGLQRWAEACGGSGCRAPGCRCGLECKQSRPSSLGRDERDEVGTSYTASDAERLRALARNTEAERLLAEVSHMAQFIPPDLADRVDAYLARRSCDDLSNPA